MQVAPRGHGYYDAFANAPDDVVTAMSIGSATPVSGLARHIAGGLSNAGGTVENFRLLVITPGASGESVGLDCFYSGPNAYETATIDADALSSTAAYPAVPVRGSVRIRNVSEAMHVGGVVRVLRYPGDFPLGSFSTGPSANAVRDLIRASAHTVAYSGSELRETKQINTYVCNQSRCLDFSILPTGVHAAVAAPAMSSILILIENFGDTNGLNNTYEITACVQRLVRFQPGSILGNMARNIRTAPPHVINGHRDEEEKKGSLLSALGAFAHQAAGSIDWPTLARVALPAAQRAALRAAPRILPAVQF